MAFPLLYCRDVYAHTQNEAFTVLWMMKKSGYHTPVKAACWKAILQGSLLCCILGTQKGALYFCVSATQPWSSHQETEKFILEGLTPIGQKYKEVLAGSYLQNVLVKKRRNLAYKETRFIYFLKYIAELTGRTPDLDCPTKPFGDFESLYLCFLIIQWYAILVSLPTLKTLVNTGSLIFQVTCWEKSH